MSISTVMYTAITGLNAYGDSLSVVGNNIANADTPGFKASTAEFDDLISRSEGGEEIGHGVDLTAVSHPFLQGAIQNTESMTDLAIQGKGFFIVKDASGNSFYTRAGHFTVDANHHLANADGLVVQGVAGDITLDPAGGNLDGLQIDGNGVIRGRFSNGASLPLGQIALADFVNEEGLEALGHSLFVPTGASGEARVNAPGSGSLGSLVAGGLEASTVDLAREFVGMISFQRAFQVNSRVVTAAEQMYDDAINLKQ